MPRIRLDQALVARQLVATRSRARDVILRGLVQVAGKVVKKPAALVDTDAVICLPVDAGRYFSRGAVKLAAAMDAFDFDALARICLDIGASTGGFTQLLLERGAAKVYAVDVGHGQLHESLRADPRVVVLERCDARSLCGALNGDPSGAPITEPIRAPITDPIGAIVADVSFISLTKALGAPLALACKGAWLAALIKPQFEAGRDAIGKGGIVRDPGDRAAAVQSVRGWIAKQAGWRVIDVVPSPIAGGSGNQEFLIGAVHDAGANVGAARDGGANSGATRDGVTSDR